MLSPITTVDGGLISVLLMDQFLDRLTDAVKLWRLNVRGSNRIFDHRSSAVMEIVYGINNLHPITTLAVGAIASAAFLFHGDTRNDAESDQS